MLTVHIARYTRTTYTIQIGSYTLTCVPRTMHRRARLFDRENTHRRYTYMSRRDTHTHHTSIAVQKTFFHLFDYRAVAVHYKILWYFAFDIDIVVVVIAVVLHFTNTRTHLQICAHTGTRNYRYLM